jgi:hypothetical protein
MLLGAARCRKGLRGSESSIGGGGRLLCKAACGRRPRSESHPHCGRSAFRASKHGLASAYPGRAGQQQQETAGQQNGTAPSLSSTDMIAQKSEEGCRARMLGGEDADAEAGADAEADADADADADAGARAGGAGAGADADG